MKTTRTLLVCLAAAAAVSLVGRELSAKAHQPSSSPQAELLADGLQGAVGSMVGPDGALYVTEGVTGTITRVDPQTGIKTTFASGLPSQVIPFGGAMDVAFIGWKAYALVEWKSALAVMRETSRPLTREATSTLPRSASPTSRRSPRADDGTVPRPRR